MDTNQWPQGGIGLVNPIHHQELSAKPPASAAAAAAERKPRPVKEQALNCPRCNSTNTKFCYYNNYSLTQPRYFCKTCRRYWTEGGTLRNVPVGGGSRKNKRSSSSSSSCSSASASASSSSSSQQQPASSSALVLKKLPDLSHLTSFSHDPIIHHIASDQNPKIHENLQDLNLSSGFNIYNAHDHHHHDPNKNIIGISPKSLMSTLISMPADPAGYNINMSAAGSNAGTTTAAATAAASFYPSHVLLPMQDYKAKLNFCLDGFDGIISSNDTNSNTTARLFLPYEDLNLKPVSAMNMMSSTTSTGGMDQYGHHHQQQQNREGQEGGRESNGYSWSGMLGGGSSW